MSNARRRRGGWFFFYLVGGGVEAFFSLSRSEFARRRAGASESLHAYIYTGASARFSFQFKERRVAFERIKKWWFLTSFFRTRSIRGFDCNYNKMRLPGLFRLGNISLKLNDFSYCDGEIRGKLAFWEFDARLKITKRSSIRARGNP